LVSVTGGAAFAMEARARRRGAVRRKEAICIWVSVPEVLIFSGHLWIMARC
jgi:hypothetical protein